MRSVAFIVGSVALFAATPGRAVSFLSSVPGAPDPGAVGNLKIDFESQTLPAGISFAPGSSYVILQGIVPHRGYNPAGDLTHYMAVPGTGTSGSATLDFSAYSGPLILDFSFYWGSIDRGNVLTILTNLGSLTVAGDGLISSGFGNATSARGNRRAFFTLAPGEKLSKIVFASPTAFELDDIIFHTAAAPAPEPATWLSMILGFGAIGRTMRANARRIIVARRAA